MPRIDDQFLECVLYLYTSREAAEAGESAGGTGFVTGVKSPRIPGTFYGYAVSNKHVVRKGGASVVRINRLDGGVDIVDIEPHEWLAHPGGDDLAITLISADEKTHKVRLFDESWYLTKDVAEENNIGPGDDVFMVGRFVRHDGKETNDPSVRFGNISMKPRAIQQPSGFMQESYAVEMRSMAGYSGSPVFLYRTGLNSLQGPVTVTNRRQIWFVGVNWGYIADDWEVQNKKVPIQETAHPPRTRDVSFVWANTGMNGVVPAWKVAELLHHPQIVAARELLEAKLLAQKGQSQ